MDAAAGRYEAMRAPETAADSFRAGWGAFVRLGLLLAAGSALFNGLGAHLGATVLAQLPPDWPIVGGPLTLEGFLYGALAGLSVVAVLLVAGTFNTAADSYALLRSIPPFLSQAGLVTAIGVAYVPQTITRVREIHEAQILRGHHFRGARSLLPLAVPLLGGGLERAIQLAEAMDARGFSQPPRPDRPLQADGGRAVRTLLAVGTGGVAVGAFAMLYFRTTPGLGAIVLAAGLATIGWALHRLGRGARQTRYRREVWRRRDTAVSLLLLAALVLILGIWALRPGWWAYSPYPALAWPAFAPLAGLALALLAAPALPLLTGR